jgi:predicted kinase
MGKLNNLHIFVGLPGSGKSTKAKEMVKQNGNTILLSTDAIRAELGDVNDQSKNNEVYEIYYKRAEEALKEGKDVILDATNTTVKSRRVAVERLRKYVTRIVAHYFNVDYEVCLYRNNTRDRVVPYDVIKRMYKALQIPTWSEGFDNIVFHSDEGIEFDDDLLNGICGMNLRGMEDYISMPQTYEEIMGGNPFWGNILQEIWELPQDNSFHSFSVSRHTYYVWKYIRENYDGEDKIAMLWAALFHDAGKGFCKNFKKYEDGSVARYANFVGHENVSAQMAAIVLSQYYDTEFVLKVIEIIQYHMRLMQIGGDGSIHSLDKSYRKLNKFLGDSLTEKLEFFYEADTNAK